MHVFISDVHMTDQEAGSPVSDVELVEFAEEVDRWSQREHVHLVLLGDIIDLLRSPKWEECWSRLRSFPWSGAARDFVNFRGNHPETVALEVVQAVAQRYARWAAALKRLVGEKRLTVSYVPGNHDFMLDLSPRLRRAVCDFLSLSNDPTKPFMPFYADEGASVYATHGHSYDPVNWHQPAEGRWALGDAIVIRVVNRFVVEACRRLGVSETSAIGVQLHELDNVEPLTDVPIYVRWLADEFLAHRHEREELLAVWREVVRDLLELQPFADSQLYGDRACAVARRGLEISMYQPLAELVAEYAHLMTGVGVDYRAKAEELADVLDRKYRFIVFGHVHEPALLPLGRSAAASAMFYVNTGSWRRVVARASHSARGPFVGVRVAGGFIIEGPTGEGIGRRYRLFQQRHVT